MKESKNVLLHPTKTIVQYLGKFEQLAFVIVSTHQICFSEIQYSNI